MAKAKTATVPEGEQQQTAANFLAAQTKGKKKVPTKPKLAVNVDKSVFEKKEKTMTKAAKKTAPAKAKAKKTTTERAPRGQYAGKRITVLTKEIPARDGTVRFALLKTIIGCKNTDDALSKTIKNGEGKAQKVSSADIKFAVENKLIKLAA